MNENSKMKETKSDVSFISEVDYYLKEIGKIPLIRKKLQEKAVSNYPIHKTI